MPDVEPIKVGAGELVAGDVINGLYDHVTGMTDRLVRSFVGPLAGPPTFEDRRESGDWYTIRLTTGEETTVKSWRRISVRRPVSAVPAVHNETAGDSDTVEKITISLTVKNIYQRDEYDDVTNYFDDVEIPAPPTLDEDSDAYADWAYNEIHDGYTGTGQTAGHSWYDVEVTACSVPELVGREFQWGY